MTRVNVGAGFNAAACAAFFEADVSSRESASSSAELGAVDFVDVEDGGGVGVLVVADIGLVL